MAQNYPQLEALGCLEERHIKSPLIIDSLHLLMPTMECFTLATTDYYHRCKMCQN